jgi:hypothetical protein
MASWHLFNKHWFDRFSIPKMGGFSIWREGLDRQSLETAIGILEEGRRPLIIFPEGTTNRTNDRLQPLLDGVPFIARSAARRRGKAGKGPVVVHPVGIKYLFRGDIQHWAGDAIGELEAKLGWRPHAHGGEGLLARIGRLAEGLLSLKEIEYLGRAQVGTLAERRDRLIAHLLETAEAALGCPASADEVLGRVRACRTRLVGQLLADDASEETKRTLRDWGARVELAQQLVSYPLDYLDPSRVTDTRVLETLERMQEDFLGRARSPAPLHVVLEVDEPIEVEAGRPPRGQADPLMVELRGRLQRLLTRLAAEANPLSADN